MSLYVVRTIALCLFTYSPNFFAFAFGFYILMKPDQEFDSIVRTMVRLLLAFKRTSKQSCMGHTSCALEIERLELKHLI